jgi:tRNA pseudouridine55 synthase
VTQQTTTPLGGVLVVDKPAGWTSHDVVGRVRRLAGLRQVGHAGTLDPMATGVLLLCVGRATRLLEYLTDLPKTYLAEVTLGAATDTYDAEGEVTARQPVPVLSQEQIDAALDAFRGAIMQRPPAYSALKRDGVALYKRARAGEQVEIEPRPVTVYALDLLAFDGQTVQLRVHCGAGTYVRSIAHDLGQALGCGGHLSALRRTAVGGFTVDDAATLEQLAESGALAAALLPADAAVAHLARVDMSEAEAARLLHGQAVIGVDVQPAGPARAYGPDERFLGIVAFDSQRRVWRPQKMLAG